MQKTTIDLYLYTLKERFSTIPAHISVLLYESEEQLDIKNSNKCMRYIDATLGLGGHTKYFLEQNNKLKVIGFDQDPFAREQAVKNLKEYKDRFSIIPKNFEHIKSQKDFAPQAILFDIGVSSLQFDTPERGFSFRFSAPLDMRMNPETELTAEEIINTWGEKDLEKIFIEYGEESWGRKIAEKIVERRQEKKFTTTDELADFIGTIKPFKKKRGSNQGGHPAALVFQALRIAVNAELKVLEHALHDAIDILAPDGRLAVISFHSLEDRIVKNIFDSYIPKGKKQKYPSKEERSVPKQKDEIFYLEKTSKKPILPSKEEINANPRSRSAKMRCVCKKLFDPIS